LPRIALLKNAKKGCGCGMEFMQTIEKKELRFAEIRSDQILSNRNDLISFIPLFDSRDKRRQN